MIKLKSYEVKILNIIEEYFKKNNRPIWQAGIAALLGTERQNIYYYIDSLEKRGYIQIEEVTQRMKYITILNKSWKRDAVKIKPGRAEKGRDKFRGKV